MVRVSAREHKVAKNCPKFGLAKQNARGTKEAAYAQNSQKWKEIHQTPWLLYHKMVEAVHLAAAHFNNKRVWLYTCDTRADTFIWVDTARWPHL